MNIKRVANEIRNQDKSKSLLSSLVDRSQEHRCPHCNHKIGVGNLGPCTVFETKCTRCGSIITIGVQGSID